VVAHCPDTILKEVRSDCGDEKIWQCRRMRAGKQHQVKVSIRHCSIFADKNLSVKDIIYLMYEWTVKTSVEQAAFQLDISSRIVGKYYTFFRELIAVLVRRDLAIPLGGNDAVIEIDECQIGRRKYHRGKIPKEIWIFGGIDRHSYPPKFFIEVVPKRNRATLTEVILRRIDTQSHIISDGWSAYNRLSGLGFNHSIVNHSKNFVSPSDTSVHTQNIENLWRCFRRFLSTKGTYTRKHLNGFIDKFIFRKMHPVDPFEVLLSTCEVSILAH
jgi:hypothetical protein